MTTMIAIINQYPPMHGPNPGVVVSLQDGVVHVEGHSEVFVERLETESFEDKRTNEDVSINDGAKFIRALPGIFTGAAVRAQVIDDREPKENE